MSERVKISDLKFDQDNPNRMSLAQLDRLKASIKRWGDIVPVVTNSELLVADGAAACYRYEGAWHDRVQRHPLAH